MKTVVFRTLALASCMVGVSCFAAPLLQSASSLSAKIPRSLTALSAEEVKETTESSSPEAINITFDTTDTELLDDALQFNSSAASELLSKVNTMRSNSVPELEIDTYFDNLLALVDDIAWWARLRPLTRFSRRARRASLGRVWELSMPVTETQQSIGSDEAVDQQRRRRSLVVLLRALADEGLLDANSSIPAIAQLERKARREAKDKFQAEDMAQRLPEGLETPKYSVISSRKGYEIRKYEPFSVCSVAMNKPRPADLSKTDVKTNPTLAGASSFGALAGYLFGKNKESTAMKMTTPVLSAGKGEDRRMSFVLPSKFWDGLDAAPKPFDESGVVLEREEGGNRAVVMFGGFAGKKDVEERKKQLVDSLSKDDEWIAEPGAPLTLAQYNDPFTPPWKRRNEVSVKVVRRQESKNTETAAS